MTRKEFDNPLARASAGLTVTPETAPALPLVGEYAPEIAERLRAIKQREVRGVRLGWENGRDLVALRESLGREFGTVLAEEFPHWSKSSAYDFMAFYETFPDLREIEGLSMTTVRLLVRGTTPAGARQKILDSVREGVPMTWKQAKETIDVERLALQPPALSMDETVALVWQVIRRDALLSAGSAADWLVRLGALQDIRHYERLLGDGERLDNDLFERAYAMVWNEVEGQIAQERVKEMQRAAAVAAEAPQAQAGPGQTDRGSTGRVGTGPGAFAPTTGTDSGHGDLPEGWEMRQIVDSGPYYAHRVGGGAATATFASEAEAAAAAWRYGAQSRAEAAAQSVDQAKSASELVTLRLSPITVAAMLTMVRGLTDVALDAEAQREFVAVAAAALGEADA